MFCTSKLFEKITFRQAFLNTCFSNEDPWETISNFFYINWDKSKIYAKWRIQVPLDLPNLHVSIEGNFFFFFFHNRKFYKWLKKNRIKTNLILD